MATSSVNLVDAIADAIPRGARSQSAIVRFGTVAGTYANGSVPVTIGGTNVPCSVLHGVSLATGDWVAVLCDGDRWLVLGKALDTAGYAPGNVILGVPGSTSGPVFKTYRMLGATQIETYFGVTSNVGDGGAIVVLADNVVKAQLVIDVNAQISTLDTGSVVRPIPFAMQANSHQINSSGTSNAALAVTFHAGRFTIEPVVTISLMTSINTTAIARTYNGSTTGVTLALGAGSATMGGDYYVHWHAVQMTRGGISGLSRYESSPMGDLVTVVCPTAGCPNFEVPIDMHATEDVVNFACGVCAGSVPAANLNRRRA